MAESLVCVGEGEIPTGERYALTIRTKVTPHENASPPLSPARLDVFLASLRARGVHLRWEDNKFTLYWPPVTDWPYRDGMAWRDVEYVDVNQLALLKKFNLKVVSRNFALSTPLSAMPLVFCDVETTGNNPHEDRVIEVAICRVEPGKEPVWFVSLVNPGKKIKNSEIHKITDKMVKDQPKFVQVAPKVNELVSGAVFISHQNNLFDERFIEEELARVDIRWQPSAKLSTMTMARSLLDRASYALPELAASLELPVQQSHRAESDVRTMMALWDVLLVRANERDPIPETIGQFINL